MRKIFILICLLLCFSDTVSAEKLKFAQITDIHVSANGTNYQGRNLEESIQILKTAVNSVNNTADIDFVAFSGDNIDVSGEDDLRKFCEITKNVNKPYYITVGDHDIDKHQGLNKTEYIEIVKQYNKNQKSSDTYYYFFPNKDFIVIVMDGVMSGFITSAHGSYGEEDLAWLDEVLTKYSNKKAVIIQHYPLVEPYENKSHTTIDPEPYFDLLTNHKNVLALLSGHYHGGNNVVLKDGVYHISTPALVSSPHQYRVVEINYDHNSLFQENPKFDLKTEIIPVPNQTN